MNPLARVSHQSIAYGIETTPGTPPAVAFRSLRVTGQSLDQGLGYRPASGWALQVAEQVLVDQEPGGGIAYEVAFGAPDDLWLAQLRAAAWVTGTTFTASDITLTSSGLSSVTTDFTTLGLAVGQYGRVGTYGTARIQAIRAHALTLDCLPLGWSAGASGTVHFVGADYLTNGTTATSFTLERVHAEVGGGVFDFSGMRPDHTVIAMRAGRRVQGATVFKGLSATRNTASLSTGAVLGPLGGEVMDAGASGGVVLYEAGVVTGMIQSAAFTLKSNLKAEKSAVSLGNAGFADGEGQGLFQFDAVFATTAGTALYDKYLAGTQTSLAALMRDSAGNAYVVSLPAVRLTACRVVATDLGREVRLRGAAHALVDSATGVMARIDRIAAGR
ncbi:MAG: hypothetical protein HQL37_01680 [Alphaproteobacteria bacterium]|nr:hypothetical protein [Alphaproteobacteria bacterium]